MRVKTAFTRKDVFVVLGCVVFLLMGLGAIGSAGRRRAKEAVCLSNLRRMGSAFLMFAAENDGRFMAGWYGYGTEHTDMWMEAVRPYYRNGDLRCCPEAAVPGTDPTIGGGPYGGVPPDSTFVAWGVFEGECGQPSSNWPVAMACDYGSYGNNAYICDPPPEVTHIQGHTTAWNWRAANVAGAADIPVIGDSQWIDAWPSHGDPPPDYSGMPWGTNHNLSMYRVCINRHDGFVNWVFLDGSSRKVGLKCLWKLKWSRGFDPDRGPSEEEFNNTGDKWMAKFPPCQ